MTQDTPGNRQPLESHVSYLIARYSFTGVLHALIEACYTKAKFCKEGDKWRETGRQLTEVENANPETVSASCCGGIVDQSSSE